MAKHSYETMFLATALFALLMSGYAVYNYVVLRKELSSQQGLTTAEAMRLSNMSLVAIVLCVLMLGTLITLYFGFK